MERHGTHLNTGSKPRFVTVHGFLGTSHAPLGAYGSPRSQPPCFRCDCVNSCDQRTPGRNDVRHFWTKAYKSQCETPPSRLSLCCSKLESDPLRCWCHRMEESPAMPLLTRSEMRNHSSASGIWGFVGEAQFWPA